MWVLLTAIAGGVFWYLVRRWRKGAPADPRLGLTYWRNSGLVTGGYLLFILLGAGITRIMVGFNRSGYADLLMVGFFIAWVLYGAVWLLRLLPTTSPQPRWLTRSRLWLDAGALLALASLATVARML